jgi:hypothetical protein
MISFLFSLKILLVLLFSPFLSKRYLYRMPKDHRLIFGGSRRDSHRLFDDNPTKGVFVHGVICSILSEFIGLSKQDLVRIK